MKYIFSSALVYFYMFSLLTFGQNTSFHPFVNTHNALLMPKSATIISQANLNKGEVERQFLSNVSQNNKTKVN